LTELDRPRLRALEAFPIEQDGERLIGLRDPSGFTEQVILLPIPALDIVSLFDGERSVSEIHQVVSSRHGQAAPAAEEIARFAERLDEAGFLDSPGFAARRRGIEEAWLAHPTRPAAHAGGAYAGDAAQLTEQIGGFFVHADGPGAPEAPAGAGTLRGLLAPHIDFHRGGPTYAWAYRALAEHSDADLFVILGTCHAGMTDPFAVTLKSYDTPLISQHPPQHHGLELYRVLAAVSALRGQEVVGISALERFVEAAIHFRGAQRRVVGLERRCEGIAHAGVAGAEDHEEIGVGALEERPVGPRVGRSAAVEVDVWSDEPADPLWRR
jgi:hypothetical protein